MSSVLEHEDPDQVHQQPGHGDGEQPLMVDIRRLQGPLTDRRVRRERRVITERERQRQRETDRLAGTFYRTICFRYGFDVPKS